MKNNFFTSLKKLQNFLDGADFIDNYFGNILNAIGKRQLVVDTRQEKLMIKGFYMVKKKLFKLSRIESINNYHQYI